MSKPGRVGKTLLLLLQRIISLTLFRWHRATQHCGCNI